MMNFPRYAALLLLPALGACAVGPDFEKPAPPAIRNYTRDDTAAAGNASRSGQQFVADDIPAEWWTLFHSRALNALVVRALQNNPDLKAAAAALDVARENVLAQEGAYYPAITASASAARQKTAGVLSPTPNSGALYFSLFTPQVGVSYVPDVFGLNRRTVEALSAEEGQSRYALAAARITLTTNVVAAAIQEASLRAQIDALHRLVALNSAMLSVLQAQLSRGYASRLDVAAQEAQLAQAKAAIPSLQKQLVQQRDLLKALTGAFPDETLQETFALSSLQLPQMIPMSLPSSLVEHRPDILQATENLHAASAQIGVAIANRLPNITLSADMGSSALSLGSLFAPGTGIWDLGASVTQPIFDGGTLLHKERAARAAFVQANEQYRSTVVAAYQNVADTLSALRLDGEEVEAAYAAEQAALVTLEQTKRQVTAGYAGNLSLSTAEIAYQQSAIALVQAKAARLSDTAALFQALGGGWWNSPGVLSSPSE